MHIRLIYYRYEATDINERRSAASASIITVLPNVSDYIHKHRERLMEEKRQKLLALEFQRKQQQQLIQLQQQIQLIGNNSNNRNTHQTVNTAQRR